MWQLARLLVLERGRRMGSHSGWGGYLCVCSVIVLFGVAAAAVAAPYVRQASLAQLGAALNYAWAAWLMWGVLLGKDLSWQVHLERLTVFPAPGFIPLYAIWWVLGFLSVPMLCVLGICEALAALKGNHSAAGLLTTLAAYALFVSSVRLIVSLVRVGVFRSASLRRPYRIFQAVAIALVLGWTVVALSVAATRHALPGYQLGAVLLGLSPLSPLLRMSALVIPLALADFHIQKEVAYSGIRGPLASGGRLVARGAPLLLRPVGPGPLFGMALLGWLRNRNSLLLFLFGTLYGFFFLWFLRASDAFDFFGFAWMVLIFHAHLRGNLLGIDRGGAWLYYMLPLPVESAMRAKNASLNLLQAVMVTAVFLPALFHPAKQMNVPAWGRVVSYAVCAILVCEISGTFFSVRYPDPIVRGSQYSGGMTTGALGVGLIHTAFLGIFLAISGLARHFLPAVVFWCLLLAVPAALLAVRSALLPRWIRRTMLKDRETILQKLAVFSS
jgi:hypothetical protein